MDVRIWTCANGKELIVYSLGPVYFLFGVLEHDCSARLKLFTFLSFYLFF
jgi:hypothetical protein